MQSMMSFSQQLRLWADELRAVANEGLHWSGDNPYMQHRFRRVLRIAAEVFAAQDVRDADTIERSYNGDLSHVAPLTGGDAAIFNERGEVLLIQRQDNGLWAMPGGAFEVGETPAEGVCREAWEETGVKVEPLALIGVYDSRRCGSRTSVHLYHFVFWCRPYDSEAQPRISNETLDARWFAEADLPPRSPGHDVRIADAFKFRRGEIAQTVFDRVSTK